MKQVGVEHLAVGAREIIGALRIWTRMGMREEHHDVGGRDSEGYSDLLSEKGDLSHKHANMIDGDGRDACRGEIQDKGSGLKPIQHAIRGGGSGIAKQLDANGRRNVDRSDAGNRRHSHSFRSSAKL